jgi:D-alanyl-lipoteichoic acid acyltransferase DltB (MBOAT superfamily)
VLLLLFSITINFITAQYIVRAPGLRERRMLLFIGVTANLILLGYYKYIDFSIEIVNEIFSTGFPLLHIILPLGISFFTFTQIAFLADAYYGKAKAPNIIHYGLFVTYFPHLIAGPILHHAEMMPQFASPSTYRWNYQNISVGLTFFAIGLFKKVVLADGIAVYVAPAFGAKAPTLFEAWSGSLSYALQIYFDFSGYSDMAIGLSRLFGVVLPLNFNSPYKAKNIVDFWRRWHMTLSRFLRDYLYISLGGNRRGATWRYTNLMVTMLLGGLWHGAGWTFVIWGGLHGIYLVIFHAWRAVKNQMGVSKIAPWRLGRAAALIVTFLAVVVGWVLFRAENLDEAARVLTGMVGGNGVVLPTEWLVIVRSWTAMAGPKITFGALVNFDTIAAVWIIALLVIAWGAPNTQEFLADYYPGAAPSKSSGGGGGLRWRPTAGWAAAVAFLGAAALSGMARQSAFLYFQF